MNSLTKTKPNIRELTLQHGINYPTDEELIMMILGSGIKGISVQELSKNIVKTLNDSNWEDIIKNLLSIKGLGIGKALAIAASLELGRRRNEHKGAVIKTPLDVIQFVRNYSMENREHFLCITLNGAHEIIQIRVVSIGSINRTIVHPREIFSKALSENASAIIVCHNHPSGNCTPSENDIATTRNLIEASKIIGISLLDHIIFTKNNYYSFLENNILFSEG